ncbi:hypothetical protein [Derxia gummosa]|uniref:Uncharacterized protein n=1 Tax=Derxia gummosa DSM 723 TaxID=1121388 RepID=A0A8B6X355_9BURK|nr:hypothetical protein [Derxia gummosa]
MRSLPTARRALTIALLVAGFGTGPADAQVITYTRDADNPDRFPFMQSKSATISTNTVNTFIQFATPTGKRYFIETVTLQCSTPSASDSFPQIYLSVTQNTGPSSSTGYSLTPLALSYRGRETFSSRYIYSGSATLNGVFSDPVYYVAGGGNGISLNVYHTDTTVQPSCTGFISGHAFQP